MEESGLSEDEGETMGSKLNKSDENPGQGKDSLDDIPRILWVDILH